FRRTVYAVCRQPFAADDGCVQDDRPTFRHQRKGLLNREENAFHINVENRIEEFLGDLTQSCVLCNACIGEDDVEFSFFVFDLREKPIKIARVGNIRSNTADVPSDFIDGRRQFAFAATCDEDIGSFTDKLLRCGQADPAISAGNQCHFPFELTHSSSYLPEAFSPLNVMTVLATCAMSFPLLARMSQTYRLTLLPTCTGLAIARIRSFQTGRKKLICRSRLVKLSRRSRWRREPFRLQHRRHRTEHLHAPYPSDSHAYQGP